MSTTTPIRTSDLIGPALDWAVEFIHEPEHTRSQIVNLPCLVEDQRYSSDWSLAGPIIERERLSLMWMCDDTDYRANTQSKEFPLTPLAGIWQFGPTPLIAAMRCYVASKLGDVVEIPNELLVLK